jgi:hypothetical protein
MAGILKCDQVQSDSNLAFNIAGSNVAFMNATSLQMVGSNVSLAGTNVITNGKVVSSGMPLGAVLQVVSTAKTDAFSTSSGTFVDITGMSVSITPTASSSKIMVFCSMPIVGPDTSSGVGFALNRNGTLINQSTAGTTQNGVAVCFWASTSIYGGTSFNYLDSPATTSALTYKIQMLTSSSTTCYINRRNVDTYFGASCTLTVMEIAA